MGWRGGRLGGVWGVCEECFMDIELRIILVE